jgi:RNA polymerase sigma factor (TIGR02999 family)
MTSNASFELGARARSVTSVLDQVNGGGDGAFGRLVSAVYDDLRRVAANRMYREFHRPLASLTESPTAIVHEAILKLRDQRTKWKNGDHFFAVATRLLGYVIGDYKKRRLASKRGQKRRDSAPDEILACLPDKAPAEEAPDGLDAIAVIEALHERYPRKAEVVTLRILAGRSMPDVAKMIGVSLPTAERDWKFAKTWMRDYLTANGASP